MLAELAEITTALLRTPAMQALWQVNDAGMPVFAHTVDVTMLALARVPAWEEEHGPLDVGAIVIGGLLHDLTKATCRNQHTYSHSWTMKHNPSQAITEAADALDLALQWTRVQLPGETIEHAWHIVVSHHGPWGRIQPMTPEAVLVHRCDLQSAREHRLTPYDANDILPLLSAGRSIAAAARDLSISSSTLRGLLRNACRYEELGSWQELLPVWQERGRVRTGTPERERQIAAAREVLRIAQSCPESLVNALNRLTAAAIA